MAQDAAFVYLGQFGGKGIACAVKQAEALIALGLTTAKRGAYASPVSKPYNGLLEIFEPRLMMDN